MKKKVNRTLRNQWKRNGNIALSLFLLVLALVSVPNTSRAKITEKEVRVIDGDTIAVLTEKKVRFACIDAVEKKQTFGEQGTQYLKDSIKGKTVTIHNYDTDSFGRDISEVYADDLNLNVEMVRQGYAVIYEGYENCLEMEKYHQAQSEAIKNKKGLHSFVHKCLPSNYRAKKCNW